MLINVLIAVAVSLIVNFSYFVFMILHRTARMPSEHPVSENSTLFMVLEVLFYMAVSFILLTVFTHNLSESKIRSRSFPKRLLAALVISVVVYFLAPYMNRAGDVKPAGNQPLAVLRATVAELSQDLVFPAAPWLHSAAPIMRTRLMYQRLPTL